MTHATGNPQRVPVRIGADTSYLSGGDRNALIHLIQAVKLIHPIWLRQMDGRDFTPELTTVAIELEAAAQLVRPSNLQRFLLGRARAFRTNSYHASDSEWVQCLGAPFELIIGPFEPSEKLGGAKEFEGTLGIVLPDYQEKVRQYEQLAIEFEEVLGQRYGFMPRYTSSPITIVDEVVAAGGATAFIAMASKLPNDEDIRASVGSKTTLFRNIIEAKFNFITIHIARRMLGVELEFETLMKFVIGHELSHGFAFRFQRPDFGPLASPLEEAKADVFGILFMYFLAERGIISRETADEAAIACIADSLREIRLDLEEAHAVGALIRFNWFRGAALFFEDSGIVVERKHLFYAFTTLGEQLCVRTKASLHETKAFVEEWGGVPNELRSIVQSLEDLPVDIDPIFEV